MDTDRHEELVSKGYTVQEVKGEYFLMQHGKPVSGPHFTRAAAWSAASEDSYVRSMSGKSLRR